MYIYTHVVVHIHMECVYNTKIIQNISDRKNKNINHIEYENNMYHVNPGFLKP